MESELNRDNASSVRESTVSTTSSRRSSGFRAVEEAAANGTGLLQAEAEAAAKRHPYAPLANQ